MSALMKRALQLLHFGYEKNGKRYYPKWTQCYVIAKREQQKKNRGRAGRRRQSQMIASGCA